MGGGGESRDAVCASVVPAFDISVLRVDRDEDWSWSRGVNGG